MNKPTPKCKHCRERFTPIRSSLEKYCLDPECVKVWVQVEKSKKEKKQAKDWRDRKKEMKVTVLTNQDWLKLTQGIFNKFIRKRDELKPCISCSKEIKGVRHASHYLSSGGHSSVRFHEDNVHVSCYKCNVMLSGNQIKYRIELIKTIGTERVEHLENICNEIKRWEVEELKELIAIYKNKTK